MGLLAFIAAFLSACGGETTSISMDNQDTNALATIGGNPNALSANLYFDGVEIIEENQSVKSKPDSIAECQARIQAPVTYFHTIEYHFEFVTQNETQYFEGQKLSAGDLGLIDGVLFCVAALVSMDGEVLAAERSLGALIPLSTVDLDGIDATDTTRRRR